ncbi:hypothetical protein [Caenimonas aquaedulcis]|uniref:Calcium-binding protein n=1 Tax=Caenimonas aquaedulcis TaxID=2793270 RepID=A0A931H467_9BURK|nr:hypothetical protein [Caenimonas aquaedulcis]MBG9388192.1 hypothetical protein [Caenimonas aquaedulcis]
MAGADSIIGGGTDLSAIVDEHSVSLIDQFLLDTVGGTAHTTDLDGAILVTGTGSNGEVQGVLLPNGVAVLGTINSGTLHLDVSLPDGLGLVFAAHDGISVEEVSTFLFSIVDQYLPPGTNDALRANLLEAVDDLVSSIEALGLPSITVTMVDFINSTPSTQLSGEKFGALPSNEVTFDPGNSGSTDLFAFNLRSLSPSELLLIKNVENALVSGDGVVKIGDNNGTLITSDSANQQIIGGGGNDTLIGGGGHDTLTGGAGDDVFAFSRVGDYTITDFTPGHDTFAFKLPGVTNVQELLHMVTSSEQTTAGVTFHLANDTSITLVGVTASELTADMIKFTF